MKRLILLAAVLLLSSDAYSQGHRRSLARVTQFPAVTPCEMGKQSDGLIQRMRFSSVENWRVNAGVEVLGKFDKGVKGLTDCFGPRFLIEAYSIRRPSPAAPSFLE